MSDEQTAILAPNGKPARKKATADCPRCGAELKHRTASSGFGIAHPVCAKCGHEFVDEVWRG